MTTLPLAPDTSDDPIVKSVFDRLRQRWGTVLNLYRALAWSPELMKSWASFAWSLRFETTASRRLRELLIIRIASLLGADYEYGHHLHMAMDEGITKEQVAAMASWKSSTLFDESERVILALADDLALKPAATAETMAAVRAAFSERHAVELLVTGAFYCGVARIVGSLQLPLESNHADLRARDVTLDGARLGPECS